MAPEEGRKVRNKLIKITLAVIFEIKSILLLLFARLDLLRTRTRRKNAWLQSLWRSHLSRKNCQPKKEEKTTNLTELSNFR